MKIKKPPLDTVLVRHLASRFNLSLEEATVFVRRGVTEYEDILFFLEHSAHYLHSPFTFHDSEAFVNRVMNAATHSERVCVYGDSDVDGITSTALMVLALRSLDIDVEWKVPGSGEDYGICIEDIDRAIKKGIQLIITVDCGISCTKEIEYARRNMIDVIVVDHHEPPPETPSPYAIINPKLTSDTYPFPALCAAALVYKCIYALLIARTQYYDQELCVLNLVPLDGGVRADLLFSHNFVVRGTKSITFTPETRSKMIVEFLEATENKAIFVFDAPVQEKLLSQAFDQGIDLQCFDMKTQLQKMSPKVNNQSLLEIMDRSRLKNYKAEVISELDMLHHILCITLFEQEQIHQKAEAYGVDLVMLATLADVMPMKNENRILVQRGYKKLQSHPVFGLSILLQALKLDSSIELEELSYKFTPLLNGVGREGHASLAVELMLVDDVAKAEELVKKIIDINKQKSKKLTALKKNLILQAEEEITHNKNHIIVKSDELPTTYTGLLAGTIQRKFSVPSVVLASEGETVVASIRCHKSFFAPKAIESLGAYIINGGGHNAAAGFSFVSKDQTEVIKKLRTYFNEKSKNVETTAISSDQQADLFLTSHTYSTDLLRKLMTKFYPYGNEWNVLRFFIKDAQVEQWYYLANGQHLKYDLRIGKEKIPLLIWNYKEHEFFAGDICEKVTSINVLVALRSEIYMNLPQVSLVAKQIYDIHT